MPANSTPVKKCGGHNRQGKPCGHPAGHGTTHPGYGNCKYHLGSTRTGVASAQLQEAREAVSKIALTQDDPAVLAADPRIYMAVELARSTQAIEEIGVRLNKLGWFIEESQGPGGAIVSELRHHTGTKTGETVPHALYKMWGEERDRGMRAAKVAHDAGVEGKRLEIAQDVGLRLYNAVRLAAREMGLDHASQELLLKLVARNVDRNA